MWLYHWATREVWVTATQKVAWSGSVFWFKYWHLSDTTEWLSMYTIIPFTHLVYKLVVFSIFRVVWPAPGSIYNSLQRNSTFISHHSSFPPKPPIPSQSLFYFMSLKIFLFWIFHMKGLSQYVDLWNWALSLSIYSSFIHVVALISTSFLFMTK